MNIEGGSFIRLELYGEDVHNFINAIHKICDEETKIAFKKYGLQESELEVLKRIDSNFG